MQKYNNIKIDYWDKVFIKDVFRKAFPLIIGTIITGLIGIVDSTMVGLFQSGDSGELASLSLASKYISIMTIVTTAFISMTSFLVMQYIGKKNPEKAKETIKMLVFGSMIFISILIVIGWTITDDIMSFFQGDNYGDPSTKNGIAQDYLKISMFSMFPITLLTIYLNGLVAFGKQKIMTFIVLNSIAINALFNWIFYKVANFGVNGIAYSTLLAECISFLIVIGWVLKFQETRDALIFNVFLIWKIDLEIFKIGIARWAMAGQVLLWNAISLGLRIIWSRWYGDEANQILAIVSPVIAIFYGALDGISTTKGYYVGKNIGAGNQEQAYINDKRINFLVFLVAVVEGSTLASVAFPVAQIWSTVDKDIQLQATWCMISVGLTYPIAAMSKTMLGSFKVAGMGKTIILSNGLFALFFEFMIPLVLFIIHITTNTLYSLEFWHLFVISRAIKLIKLPPTLYFWRKKKWLIASV